MSDVRETRPGAESPTRLRRREVLGAGAALAVAAALPVSPRTLGLLGDAGAARPARFRDPLVIPEVLTDARIELPMRAAKVQALPGERTRMWTYGGTFPGPTIRRPAGEPTEVTFVNKLPKAAGELSVHLHGGHNRSEHDGQPGGLTEAQPRALYCRISPGLRASETGNDLLISPGGRRTYLYDGIEDGGPERAAFQWYHDHRLERTARNVWRGLAGMWITDDDFDDSLPLPKGKRDIPLMIADRAFDRDNQLKNPFHSEARAPNDGVTGKHVLVNGRHRPYHRVAAARYRLRILNASNFRAYTLELGNGAEMVQIATESGLMPRSVPRRRILLGPGERVELVVNFRPFAGERVILRSVGRKSAGLGPPSYSGPLMEFRVARGTEPRDAAPPEALRPLPRWVADAPAQPQRNWKITVGGGFRPTWLINGQTFDPSVAEARPVLGTTETWEFRNQTKVGHTMHIHHTDWYMLSRNGRKPKPWERCLKETFFMDPGDRIVVAGRFSDFTGKYVIHCHMLDHEDHGLMSQFETVAPQ